MSFASDTFTTGTPGELLKNRSGWAQNSGITGDCVLTGEARERGTIGTALHCNIETPPSADYSVGCSIKFFTFEGSYTWPTVRASNSDPDGYKGGYDPGGDVLGWAIYKTVSGVSTLLGSTPVSGLLGQTRNVTLSVSGSVIRLFVDGSIVVEVEDSSITRVGLGGIFNYNTVENTDSVGAHWTDYLAGDVIEITPTVVALSFVSNADESLTRFSSENGIRFYQEPVSYTPSEGTVRDPSLWIDSEGAWWMAHTAYGFDSGQVFLVAKSIDGGNTFSGVAAVDISSVGSVDRVWSPEWVILPNGDIHIVVAVSTGDIDGPFQIHEVHPLNNDMTAWSGPVLIAPVRTNMIDPFVSIHGSIFRLWFKNEDSKVIETATSTALTGTYTLESTGDWAGWGAGVEGFCLIATQEGHRAYMDRYQSSAGLAFSDSNDLGVSTGTWTELQGVVSPIQMRHCTPVSLTQAPSPAGIAHWLEKRAAVQAGTGYAKILVVGDSTAWGFGGGGSNPPTQSSWPAKLVDLFLADGIPATIGLNAYYRQDPEDNRWAKGSWASFVDGGGFCVGLLGYPGTGSCSFAPGYLCDTADIYFVRNAIGDSAVSVDGGSPTVLSGSGAAGIQKTTITFPLGDSHTFTFSEPTAPGWVFVGIDCFDSTVKSVRISLTGMSGSKASDWATSVTGYDTVPAIRAYAPDLTVINLGINDAIADVSVASWTASMMAIIGAAQESGDVLVVSNIPSQSGVLSTREGEYAFAGASLGVEFADLLNEVFVSWASANSNGWMYDALHANSAGYSQVADFIYQRIAPTPTPSVNSRPFRFGGRDRGFCFKRPSADTQVPVNDVTPVLSNTVGIVGTIISCDSGMWSNDPTAYGFSWTFNSGPTGITINTIDTQDFGAGEYQCRVRATNAGGSAYALSDTATITE